MRCFLPALLAGLLLTSPLVAQPTATAAKPKQSGEPSFVVTLPSGPFTPPNNVDDFFGSATPDDIVGGVYYRVVQFWVALPAERRTRLEHSWHVQLLQPLPGNAYVVAFPASFNRNLLQGYGVRSVVPLTAEQKLGALAQQPASGASRRLRIHYAPTADTLRLLQDLRQAGAAALALHAPQYFAEAEAPGTALGKLAELPAVVSVVEVAAKPTLPPAAKPAPAKAAPRKRQR